MTRTCTFEKGVMYNSRSKPYKAKQTKEILNFETLHFFKDGC